MDWKTANEAEVREFENQESNSCDLTLIGEGEQQLLIHSHIFKRHCRWPYQNRGSQSNNHIRMNDISIDVLNLMCRILYTGRVPLPTLLPPDSQEEHLILSVRTAAVDLEIERVVHLVDQYLNPVISKTSTTVNTVTEDGKEPESEMPDSPDSSAEAAADGPEAGSDSLPDRMSLKRKHGDESIAREEAIPDPMSATEQVAAAASAAAGGDQLPADQEPAASTSVFAVTSTPPSVTSSQPSPAKQANHMSSPGSRIDCDENEEDMNWLDYDPPQTQKGSATCSNSSGSRSGSQEREPDVTIATSTVSDSGCPPPAQPLPVGRVTQNAAAPVPTTMQPAQQSQASATSIPILQQQLQGWQTNGQQNILPQGPPGGLMTQPARPNAPTVHAVLSALIDRHKLLVDHFKAEKRTTEELMAKVVNLENELKDTRFKMTEMESKLSQEQFRQSCSMATMGMDLKNLYEFVRSGQAPARSLTRSDSMPNASTTSHMPGQQSFHANGHVRNTDASAMQRQHPNPVRPQTISLLRRSVENGMVPDYELQQTRDLQAQIAQIRQQQQQSGGQSLLAPAMQQQQQQCQYQQQQSNCQVPQDPLYGNANHQYQSNYSRMVHPQSNGQHQLQPQQHQQSMPWQAPSQSQMMMQPVRPNVQQQQQRLSQMPQPNAAPINNMNMSQQQISAHLEQQRKQTEQRLHQQLQERRQLQQQMTMNNIQRATAMQNLQLLQQQQPLVPNGSSAVPVQLNRPPMLQRQAQQSAARVPQVPNTNTDTAVSPSSLQQLESCVTDLFSAGQSSPHQPPRRLSVTVGSTPPDTPSPRLRISPQLQPHQQHPLAPAVRTAVGQGMVTQPQRPTRFILSVGTPVNHVAAASGNPLVSRATATLPVNQMRDTMPGNGVAATTSSACPSMPILFVGSPDMPVVSEVTEINEPPPPAVSLPPAGEPMDTVEEQEYCLRIVENACPPTSSVAADPVTTASTTTVPAATTATTSATTTTASATAATTITTTITTTTTTTAAAATTTTASPTTRASATTTTSSASAAVPVSVNSLPLSVFMVRTSNLAIPKPNDQKPVVGRDVPAYLPAPREGEAVQLIKCRYCGEEKTCSPTLMRRHESKCEYASPDRFVICPICQPEGQVPKNVVIVATHILEKHNMMITPTRIYLKPALKKT